MCVTVTFGVLLPIIGVVTGLWYGAVSCPFCAPFFCGWDAQECLVYVSRGGGFVCVMEHFAVLFQGVPGAGVMRGLFCVTAFCAVF